MGLVGDPLFDDFEGVLLLSGVDGEVFSVELDSGLWGVGGSVGRDLVGLAAYVDGVSV